VLICCAESSYAGNFDFLTIRGSGHMVYLIIIVFIESALVVTIRIEVCVLCVGPRVQARCCSGGDASLLVGGPLCAALTNDLMEASGAVSRRCSASGSHTNRNFFFVCFDTHAGRYSVK
jgi:hypothetical protein